VVRHPLVQRIVLAYDRHEASRPDGDERATQAAESTASEDAP
jgi:phosphate starvation-inducible protein PhoH